MRRLSIVSSIFAVVFGLWSCDQQQTDEETVDQGLIEEDQAEGDMMGEPDDTGTPRDGGKMEDEPAVDTQMQDMREMGTADTADPTMAVQMDTGETDTGDADTGDADTGDADARAQTLLDVRQKEPFGQYVTDAEGRSLYIFLNDSPDEDQSNCYGACAEAWPPLLVDGESTAGADAIDEGEISTITRTGGREQVTYYGWPLYYFARDTDPGDTEGQHAEGFGAEWYLVSPDGERIEAEQQ